MDWVKPRALRPGDRIGVCAPSGPVDAERLTMGVAEVVALGFDPVVPDGLLQQRGFTAGTVERRVLELHRLFEDDTIAGVFCARGGAGQIQLLRQLDLGRLLAHPKVFLGYSDLTFLHALLNNGGLVTFHGPMVAREMAAGAYHRASLLAALTAHGTPYATEEDDLLALRGGIAEGRLLGGCLSILAAGLGTPWALRMAEDEPVILLLEDIDEPPYKIDRMLRQLRAAGALERVCGIVLGDFPGCSPPMDAGFTLEDVILEALEEQRIPIALGLSSGHTKSPQVTLPLGVRARLECGRDRVAFRILEPAVR